jgi:hypothetical protein
VNPSPHRARHLSALTIVVVSVAASAALMLAGLATATGEVLVDPDMQSYSTEYFNFAVYPLALVLVPLLGLAAAYSGRVALLGVLGVGLTQVWGIKEGNNRLAEAGWGSGLEVLAFALPIGTAVLALAAVAIGAGLGRRRRRQDQYTMTLSPTTT